MSSPLDISKKDLELFVPMGGSKSMTSVPFSMQCRHILIRPPSNTARFRVQLDHVDGFPFRLLPDPPGMFTGNTIKDVELFMVETFHVYIIDATQSGIYKVKFIGVKARV